MYVSVYVCMVVSARVYLCEIQTHHGSSSCSPRKTTCPPCGCSHNKVFAISFFSPFLFPAPSCFPFLYVRFLPALTRKSRGWGSYTVYLTAEESLCIRLQNNDVVWACPHPVACTRNVTDSHQTCINNLGQVSIYRYIQYMHSYTSA